MGDEHIRNALSLVARPSGRQSVASYGSAYAGQCRYCGKRSAYDTWLNERKDDFGFPRWSQIDHMA